MSRINEVGLLTLRFEWEEIARKSRSRKAHGALVQLLDYANGVITQYNRIGEARSRSMFSTELQAQAMELIRRSDNDAQVASLLTSPTALASILQFYLDTHFFLVCVDKVQKLIKYIAEADGDSRLIELWNEVKPKFKPFVDARNFFEHIDDRIKILPEHLALSATDGKGFDYVGRDGTWQTITIDESVLNLVADTFNRLVDIYKSRRDRDEPWRD